MTLQSRLFQGDRALDACLVKDSAHITPGTRGPHVPKIQRALATLDGALIATVEVQTGTYGQSTADAVLAYKRRRSIINKSYQTQADDIVGKMTIARLDAELAALDKAPPARGCRHDDRGGIKPRALNQTTTATASALGVRDGDATSPPRAELRVMFQFATTPGLPNLLTQANLSLLQRANALLRPHGLRMVPRAAPDSFPFPHSIDSKNAGDVAGLRKASEKAAPGQRDVLRYIFCQYDTNRMNETATSQGAATTIDVDQFPNFVIMNPQHVHPDRGTFLHEAIHCSADRFMGDIHDKDESSVFAHATDRTILKPEHATSLRKSFFGPGT